MVKIKKIFAFIYDNLLRVVFGSIAIATILFAAGYIFLRIPGKHSENGGRLPRNDSTGEVLTRERGDVPVHEDGFIDYVAVLDSRFSTAIGWSDWVFSNNGMLDSGVVVNEIEFERQYSIARSKPWLPDDCPLIQSSDERQSSRFRVN